MTDRPSPEPEPASATPERDVAPSPHYPTVEEARAISEQWRREGTETQFDPGRLPHFVDVPTVVCAVCTHAVRVPDGCACHCHWDCQRMGHHRYAPTADDIERRILVCYRCAEPLALGEAHA